LETAVDKHLAKRLVRISDPTTRGFLPSLVIHSAIVGLVFLGGFFSPKTPKPVEIRPVMIVPLQALGVPNPPARTERPAPRVEPAKAEPEPAPEKPPEPKAKKPEPKPEPKDALVLPDKKKKRPEPKKPTPPEPTSRQQPPPQQSPPATSNRSTGRDAGNTAPQRRGSARGNIAGTSAFGGAVGLDDPNFTYNYYVDQMLALISAQWTRPNVGEGIEAALHFRIDRRGKVSDVEIRTPSGSSTFDLAALRAIHNASPLPPLPSGYSHDSLGVNLLFR